jgi:hypothetical protein
MPGHLYNVDLEITAAQKYKTYLEEIVFDYAGVSDNIAYHFSYLEYLYQLEKQIDLESFPVLHGLRLKTIIVEIASCAEVLIYDALVNLEVKDKWKNTNIFKLNPKIGFAVLLDYAGAYGVVTNNLHGRLHKLFDLRHKIHLTRKGRDPYDFNKSLLGDSEKTLEDLLKHFLRTRIRNISQAHIDIDNIPLPWKR